MQQLLEVTVNSIKTRVKPGRIAHALRSAGVPVQQMCSDGSCRMCVCSVDGRPVTACNAEIRQDMSIVTASPELHHLHRDAMEVLLNSTPGEMVTRKVFFGAETQEKLGEVQAKELSLTEAKEILQFISKYPKDEKHLLTNILTDVVDKLGFVSDSAIVAIAHHTGISPGEIECTVAVYHVYYPRTLPHKSTMLYLCNCVNCRRQGAASIEHALQGRSDIDCRAVPWLGWCVNGAPAAMVRHQGDCKTHFLLHLKENDPRLSPVASCRNPDPPGEIVSKSMNRFLQGPDELLWSTLEDIRLSAEDKSFLMSQKQCPVSRRAFTMDREDIIKTIHSSTMWACGAGFPEERMTTVMKETSETKYVVANALEAHPGSFKEWYLLSQPNTRMRVISGMSLVAHTVGASACIMYLRYEYRVLAAAIQASFARYMLLNPRMPRDFKFDVVIGVRSDDSSIGRTFPSDGGLCGLPTLFGDVEAFSWIPTSVYHSEQLSNGSLKRVMLLSISGDVPKPTVAEFPADSTLETVLQECAAPIDDIRAVHVGGTFDSLTMPSALSKPLALEKVQSIIVSKRSFCRSEQSC